MKPNLKLVPKDKTGPSLSFLMLRRNPFLPSPERFEPTTKREGDIVL
jgi:hypothetical protein